MSLSHSAEHKGSMNAMALVVNTIQSQRKPYGSFWKAVLDSALQPHHHQNNNWQKNGSMLYSQTFVEYVPWSTEAVLLAFSGSAPYPGNLCCFPSIYQL